MIELNRLYLLLHTKKGNEIRTKENKNLIPTKVFSTTHLKDIYLL